MAETHQAGERYQEAAGIAVLWLVVLAGPLAWLLGLTAQYSLVRVACAKGTMLPLHAVSVATLALALGGAAVGWREWRRTGRQWPGEGDGTLPRSRFMVVLGLLASAFFTLVILAQWLTNFFLNPCMAI